MYVSNLGAWRHMSPFPVPSYVDVLEDVYTMCLKKVPTFKLSVTLSNLNQFSKFLHCWKAYEIGYKIDSNYPPHLRHVATLPREIKNSNFLQIVSMYGRKCKQIPF